MSLEGVQGVAIDELDLKKPSLFTLIILISLGSIGAALFTPTIPSLIRAFGVSGAESQMTITLYLAGYAIGQLIYAPLAKKFGRKQALFAGILLSAVGSIGCLVATMMSHFSSFIACRFITALGSSAGLSLTFLIISDFFSERRARKVTAYTMLAFAVVPGIAIAVGGFLVRYLGWESCFYFYILYNLAACYLVYRLPDLSIKKQKLKMSALMKKYKQSFTNPLLMTYSTLIGITTALVYIFASTAPLIVIREMNIGADVFGVLNLIPASGYVLGNMIAARLSHYFEIKTVIRWGVSVIGLGMLALAFVVYGGHQGVFGLFLPVFVIYLGIPMFYSNAAVIATYRSSDKANASSVMSFMNIGLALVGVSLIEMFPGDLATVLTSAYIGLYAFFVVIFTYAFRLLNRL